MRALLYLLLAGALLSVLKAAVTVILLTIAALIVWGVLVKPNTMAAWAIALFMWWLLTNHPLLGWPIIAFGFLPMPKRMAHGRTQQCQHPVKGT